LAVDSDPFSEINQVRGCIQTCLKTGGLMNCRQHRSNAAFAVCPGYMDRLEFALRIVKMPEQISNVIQPELHPEELELE
jgi:hypothetical protein